MLKTILNMLAGALIAASVSAAFAVVGNPPVNGFGAVDGTWLNGLAGGLNNVYQSGITAAGTTQATATQLPSGVALVEVDTAAASTGVALPPCLPGTELNLYNNGAQTLSVYPTVPNNPVTAAQDTINNGTSLSGGIATHTLQYFSCAKAGVWASK
jgi:hypothetical protein